MTKAPLLLQRNYATYWFPALSATAGMWMWRVVAPVMIYEETQSPLMLGVLSVASYGPVLAFSFVGGVLADRVPRRRLIALTHALISLNFAAVAVLGATGHLTAPVVLIAAVCESVLYALSKPAMQAIVPELVAPHEVGRAVAVNITNFSIAQLIGPTLATVALVTGGRALAIGVAAVLYAPMVVAVFLTHTHELARVGVSTDRGSAMLRGTWVALRHGAVLQRLASIALGSIALEGAVRVLAPQFATEFGVPESYSGLIIGAQALGSVLAVFVVTRSEGVTNQRRIVAAYVVMALAVLGFAGSPVLSVALALAVTVGLAQTVGFSVATGEIQAITSPAARGRVMAFHSMALLGVRPIAGLLAGALSTGFGPRIASAAFSLFALGSAATAYRRGARSKVLAPAVNL